MQSTPIPQFHPSAATMTTPLTGNETLERLFVDHYRGLVRLVSGLVDDNATCEEVVQDAFAAMLRSTSPPRPGRELAYLRSAVLNGARSQLRRRQVRRRHLQPVAGFADAAEHTALERVENQRVLAAIRALPRRQREVLLLRFQAELSEAEIAETLGITHGSVKTHASRGLAAVRTRLEESR